LLQYAGSEAGRFVAVGQWLCLSRIQN